MRDGKTLLVLAAGVGSRYGGLKQMDPIGPGGAFILDYSVYDALRCGFDEVVFVIRHAFADDFREIIGKRWEARVPVRYVCQELDALPDGFNVPEGREKPWGTGHAVWVAREAVSSSFAVINADDFYGREAFSALAAFFDRSDSGATRYGLVAFELAKTLSAHGSVCRGVCSINPEGGLISIVENTRIERRDGAIVSEFGRLAGDTPVSMNMLAFHPTVFGDLDALLKGFLAEHGEDLKAEFYIPVVLDALTRRGDASVEVLRTSSQWFGVTHADDRELVAAELRKLSEAGVYPTSLWGDMVPQHR